MTLASRLCRRKPLQSLRLRRRGIADSNAIGPWRHHNPQGTPEDRVRLIQLEGRLNPTVAGRTCLDFLNGKLPGVEDQFSRRGISTVKLQLNRAIERALFKIGGQI